MRGVQNAAHSRTILSLFMTIHKFNWIIVSELVLVKKFHRLVFNFRLRFKSRSLILRFYLKLFIGYNLSVWGHSRTRHLMCIHFAIISLHFYKYSLSDSLIAQTTVFQSLIRCRLSRQYFDHFIDKLNTVKRRSRSKQAEYKWIIRSIVNQDSVLIENMCFTPDEISLEQSPYLWGTYVQYPSWTYNATTNRITIVSIYSYA